MLKDCQKDDFNVEKFFFVFRFFFAQGGCFWKCRLWGKYCLEFSHKQENWSGESENLFISMLEMLTSETIPGELKMTTRHGMGASSGWEANTPFRAFQTWKQSLKPKSSPERWLKTCPRGVVWPHDCAMCQDSGRQVWTPRGVTSQQQPRRHEQMHVLWFPLLEGKDDVIMSYLKDTEIAASSCY